MVNGQSSKTVCPVKQNTKMKLAVKCEFTLLSLLIYFNTIFRRLCILLLLKCLQRVDVTFGYFSEHYNYFS